MTAADWLLFKDELVRATALSRDALHIHLAVLAQVAAAVLLRRKLGDWLPWLAVFALALLNEAADLWVEVWPRAEQAKQAAMAVHDLLNTMIMPSLLLALSRWGRRLIGRS